MLSYDFWVDLNNFKLPSVQTIALTQEKLIDFNLITKEFEVTFYVFLQTANSY